MKAILQIAIVACVLVANVVQSRREDRIKDLNPEGSKWI